jgi:hypothetical protein
VSYGTSKYNSLTCVTCRQPVPEDIEQLDYFGQVALRPAVNDVGNFLEESYSLVESIGALFKLLSNVDKSALDDALLSQCFWMGWELTDEAVRRVKLAQTAWQHVRGFTEDARAESAQAPAKKEG